MTETKFKPEELAKITELQAEYQKLGTQLLQLRMATLSAQQYLDSLKEEQTTLDNLINEVNEQEKASAQELESKYGKGELNMETGVFTPIV